MTPRYVPETAARLMLESDIRRGRALAEEGQRKMIRANARPMYGPESEHSFFADSALASLPVPDQKAQRRLLHDREAHAARAEKRAISTTTLGGLVPTTISPWVEEAVAYGVRSGAPLATALERLPLPPVGMNASWAKITTGATVTNQTAENAALTASADVVVSSTSDALKTLAAYADFSSQARDQSGGWLDRVLGEELGRAFAARLEQQLWSGTGASGQITGLTVMTGNSSSTVAGQTLANITAKLNDQLQQIATNLGALPDLITMAPRRYASLNAACNALGLALEDALPDGLTLVVSPAAPVNLGAGTNEDWIVLLNKASTPLVYEGEPRIEFHNQGPSAGTTLLFRLVISAYLTLGVSRRPEGVGIVKGATTPSF